MTNGPSTNDEGMTNDKWPRPNIEHLIRRRQKHYGATRHPPRQALSGPTSNIQWTDLKIFADGVDGRLDERMNEG
jgi:hypothetical protein